jgi:ABC-2 type transport system permease protein
MTAAVIAPGRAGSPRSAGRGGLTGVRELARLAVRRDRIMLPAWVYVLTGAVAEVAFGLKKLYPTAVSREALVAGVVRDPALAFLYGQLHGDSLGALTAWRYAAYGALGAALMSIFLVIRHTRADEQAGRLELVGSAAVGRHAPLTAGLAVAAVANLAVVLLVSVVLIVLGLPSAGSVAFGLAAGGCGLVFAALAAVTAQVSGTARAARGMAIAVLGGTFLLRGIGDSAGASGPAWLSWLSPIGWAELTRPFAGDRWWVLGLSAGTAVVLGGAAFWLAARRDQGAGLVAPRPAPASAGRALGGPLGLAWRLQRGNLAAWTFGLFVEGAAVGSVAKGIGALFGTNTHLRQAFERIGGQSGLTSAYLAGVMSLAGLVAAAYAVSAVLRLHSEEAAQLADPVLATPTGRLRWAASHLVVVVAGTALVLAAAGVGTGLFYGLRAGGVGTQVVRLLGAGLVQLPAALVVAGVAVALFGLLPGWSVTGGWLALGLAALIVLFGQALQLGQWLVDISPFSHVPKLPGGVVSAAPLCWLSVAALALAGVGLAGLRRRDLA